MKKSTAKTAREWIDEVIAEGKNPIPPEGISFPATFEEVSEVMFLYVQHQRACNEEGDYEPTPR